MNNPKFQIFTGKDNQYYFRLKASNGEIILSSEGYVTKAGCENGIASVKANAPFDQRYDRKLAVNSQPYFVLIAANGEIIGKSETYSSDRACENGIEVVKDTAPDAPVEDLT